MKQLYPQSIHTIFFDLDETLLDEISTRLHAIERFYDFIDSSFSLEVFRKKWDEGLAIYFPLFISNTISFLDHRRQRIRHILNDSSITDEEADRIFLVYLNHYEKGWNLFSDVIPCLESLKNFQLGIITNGNTAQQKKKIANLNLTDWFEHVVISEEVGYSKPSSQIFEIAARLFNTELEKCVYIGDKKNDDALASCKAGMNGVWLNRKEKNKQALNKSTPVCNNLDEFVAYLATVN